MCLYQIPPPFGVIAGESVDGGYGIPNQMLAVDLNQSISDLAQEEQPVGSEIVPTRRDSVPPEAEELLFRVLPNSLTIVSDNRFDLLPSPREGRPLQFLPLLAPLR